MADGKDYKATLRLPATSFPMKANLREREPQILDFWRHGKTYERMQAAAAARGGAPFRFHDGPPYANGHIHHGHILNKVLKDIVVKMRNLTGQPTEFRPGWDCHGLPIEHAVEKEIGREAARSDPSGLRHKCRDFARKWVDIQAKEFERLGVFASWDDPYLTMSHDYEALTLREFGRFVGAGAAYQGRKPVLWCHVCETALADAEVEYKDATSPSIYVRFPFTPSVGERIPALAGREGGVIIWTTTPWTLSSNLAIAFDAEATYVAEEVDGDVWIVAEALFEAFHKAIGRPEGTVITTFPGAVLDRAACRHPFIDRESMLIVGEHVTMDTGTGCVHTAPGFGEDDFVVGSRYGLPAYAPVNHQGRFTSEVPEYAGRLVFDCDDDVIAMLKDKGALLGAGKISHSYPHCWRSKNPVIFRATPQWFIKVDGAMTPQLAAEGAGDATLRARAFKAIENVRFIPSWGRDRITGMLKSRPDWCVSRQRHWGVPIVGTTCNTCGNVETSQALVDHVAAIFEREGADAWFDRPLSELIPADWKCGKCGGTDLGKVKDILDVWFDSGVSYAAVMEARLATAADPHPQTDLYLEGSDQHRGWFQSSLLASVGTRGQAPYKAVLTHGFVVDGAGRKLSKSEGNYIDPGKIMDVNGAELLRLWTAAEDYRDDIRLSDEILKGCVENYRKVRNTWRFMLGVVSDMDPATGKDGEASLAALLAEQKAELPATRASKTPRGGRHIFFKHPGHKITSRTNWPAPCLDVRGDGGYVILPPSASEMGVYQWLVEVESVSLPAWLDALLSAPAVTAAPPRTTTTTNANSLPPSVESLLASGAGGGERNAKAIWLACQLRDCGRTQGEVESLLLAYGSRCSPPMASAQRWRSRSSWGGRWRWAGCTTAPPQPPAAAVTGAW